VALGYCQLLVLSAADFQRFLASNPTAKAHIDLVAATRSSMNKESADARVPGTL
jgi:monovalent cation:H+ antiporter, CPA1 family